MSRWPENLPRLGARLIGLIIRYLALTNSDSHRLSNRIQGMTELVTDVNTVTPYGCYGRRETI